MPFLDIGSKKIHYADLRPEEQEVRETFIFIHGLGSSQNYYYAVATGLLASGFRCILFDSPGAGRSPHTPGENSIASLSEDVVSILDAMGVAKAVVVGHSMGGIVAAQLAAEKRHRVAAAVLIGPVYPSEAAGPVFEKRIETVQAHGMQPMADSIPQAAVGKAASPLAKAFIRELLLGQDPAGYCANCRIIVDAKPPNYSQIRVPVLILAGEEDKSAPLEGCKKMLGEMGSKEKKLEIMHGVGHWHCIEAYEEVGRLIKSFYHDMGTDGDWRG